MLIFLSKMPWLRFSAMILAIYSRQIYHFPCKITFVTKISRRFVCNSKIKCKLLTATWFPQYHTIAVLALLFTFILSFTVAYTRKKAHTLLHFSSVAQANFRLTIINFHLSSYIIHSLRLWCLLKYFIFNFKFSLWLPFALSILYLR